jgi:hypothetical protein
LQKYLWDRKGCGRQWQNIFAIFAKFRLENLKNGFFLSILKSKSTEQTEKILLQKIKNNSRIPYLGQNKQENTHEYGWGGGPHPHLASSCRLNTAPHQGSLFTVSGIGQFGEYISGYKYKGENIFF